MNNYLSPQVEISSGLFLEQSSCQTRKLHSVPPGGMEIRASPFDDVHRKVDEVIYPGNAPVRPRQPRRSFGSAWFCLVLLGSINLEWT
jgi:hypothetical protein